MRFIDFFAGIGGFRLGMEMAGHECVGHCEIDKHADRSYRAMHEIKEDEWFADDITRVRPEDLPEAEVYCGGFPCQAFSIAGKRGGFEDTRGTLFFEVMRLAAVRKPKYLFLENVRGLLSHDGGRTFGAIVGTMAELGYDAEWQVLNSKDFGVPQNRERVFIIGHLGSGSGREVFPITGAGGQTDIPIKRIAHRKGFCTNTQVFDLSGISGTLDTAEGGGRELHTVHKFIDQSTTSVKITDEARCITAKYRSDIVNRTASNSAVLEVRPVITPDRETKRQNGRRVKDDGEPMFTLTAQDRHGVAIKTGVPFVDKKYKEFIDKNGYMPEMFNPYNCAEITDTAPTMTAQGDSVTKSDTVLKYDGYRIRRLTPRECFRLQGFPDELFERAAKINSDSQLYKQAGNSVTVNVIYEIAKRLKNE